MGKYTIHDNLLIEKEIGTRINTIVDTLNEGIPNITSIILTGGFGRGEGSVKITGEHIVPLRDFDFVLIFKKNIPWNCIRNTKDILDDESNSKSGYKYDQKFSIDISATTLERINLFPDISTYDLKAGQVVYGDDIRSKIKWAEKDIPLRSGARLLFQKLTALIGTFSLEYLSDKKIPQSKVDTFVHEISKVYIEIGGALCIFAKQYNPYCLNRVDIIKKIYKNSFPDLYKIIPDLPQKIELSTKYKLDPNSNSINCIPIDYWFEARDDIGEVIKYYFNNDLGLSFNNWLEFTKQLEQKLRRNYYAPLIKNYLSVKKYPNNKFLIEALNLAYNFKDNVNFTSSTVMNSEISLSFPKNILSSPCIQLFSVCPLILFSLNKDGTINKRYIDEALIRLNFVKLKKKDFKEQWDEMRFKSLKLIDLISII